MNTCRRAAMHRIVICGLLLWADMQAFAARYRFLHPMGAGGLPHRQVEAMAQDRKGYIWIGTRNGLVRYDGHASRHYFHDEGNGNSLAHNFIKRLFVDSRGRLWVCTGSGVCLYRPASDDFKDYGKSSGYVSTMAESGGGRVFGAGGFLSVYDEKKDRFDALPSPGEGFIVSLCVDGRDNLYVGTNSSIYVYDATLTMISRMDPSCYSDFIAGFDGVMPMHVDHDGKLWVGRNGKGVMRIDIGKGQSEIFPGEVLSDGTVRVICEDTENRIWLGTERGITVIHPDGNIDIVRQDLCDGNSLSDNAVYEILNDRDGNIWVGSYFGGVDMMPRDNLFTYYKPGRAAVDIKGKVARTMVEVEPGIVWIATEDGGLNIHDRNTDTFSTFDRISDLGKNVHSLYHDKETSDIWIGTFRNGLFRYNLHKGTTKRYLGKVSVFGFARQSNGRLWIATTQGLMSYGPSGNAPARTGKGKLDNLFVYSLAVDKQDNVWAGTVRDGLFRIDGHDGKTRQWKKGEGGLEDNYISCVYPAADGKIWLGTNNSGVQILDPVTGNMDRLDEPALNRSTVCSISEDGYGHIWIGTSQGLFSYDRGTRAMRRFTVADGLPTNQMNFSSVLKASDGRMYMGTVNGLIAFLPPADGTGTLPPEVRLKSLSIDGMEVNAATKGSPLTDEIDNMEILKLSYDQARSFSIEYGTIAFGYSRTTNYQVWVEGLDKAWRDVGQEQRFAGYDLSPGTYVVHIRAGNPDGNGDKNREKAITIVVAAPFYRTAWAYLSYSLFLAAGIYGIGLSCRRYREKRRDARAAVAEKEKQEEINRAKLDFFTTVSHELKTPLSLIAAPLKSVRRDMMAEADSRHIETAIRNTRKLEHLIDELITFNKVETDNFSFYIQKGNPLEFMGRLTELFREMAAEKRLSFNVKLEDNGEEVWFSPPYVEHILSNLLSNAFKFTGEGGTITLKSSITTDSNGHICLYFEVADTGIGIAPEDIGKIFGKFYQTKRGYTTDNQGWGIGLALVERLVNVHKGRVEVVSSMGKGTKFKVWLNTDPRAFRKENMVEEDKTIKPLKDYDFAPLTPDAADDRKTSENLDDKKYSLLVVEDNRELLGFLQDYFSPHYNVLTAENGKLALEVLRTESVQMVISDIMMPEMDGVALCKHLKSDVSTSHIPMILLTARTGQDDVMEGYRVGAEAYVSKPFDPRLLELQVCNMIKLIEARQSEIVKAKTEDVDSIPLTPIDREFVRKINELIDEHIGDSDFSIANMTAGMAVSRSLLHIKMKNLMNMSAGEYLRHRRMILAVKLLTEGYSVSEAAYRTGFSDPNYFSKVFKKHKGESPTEFLSKNRRS